MNTKRAVTSFFLAAFVPAAVSTILSPEVSRPGDLLTALVWVSVWYVFTLPIIFAVGFATLFAVERVRYGSLFLPPLVGGLSGAIVANMIYTQGMNQDGFILFLSCGLITAQAAALIYFWPRFKLRS